MASALPHGVEDSFTSSTSDESQAPVSRPSKYREPYIIEPRAPHTHTAILLHGLGSNGRAFGSFLVTTSVFSVEKDSPSSRPLNVLYPSMKWVFPSASLRRSTRFNRVKLSSWFDIFSVQDPGHREETQLEGLGQSSQYLRDLIAGEVQELSRVWGGGEGAEKRLVLGGLSQGCAISLATLLSLDYSIGGWVGMSGFIPMRRTLEVALDPDPVDSDVGVVFEDDNTPEATSVVEAPGHDQSFPTTKALNAFRRDVLSLDELPSRERPHALSTPVFYGHGSEDKKVPCKLGNELVTVLQQLGMNVRHQVYEGLDHWIQVPEEIDDMIAVFTKNGAWPDHVDGSSMNQ